MVSSGKAGNIEMALQGCGNICGSGSDNGAPCCIQAGTALHMDNYSDYLWVHRTPLPMGLHCQNPLILGAKFSKEPQVPTTDATSSMLPDDTLHTEGLINPMVLRKERVKSKCCCLIQ